MDCDSEVQSFVHDEGNPCSLSENAETKITGAFPADSASNARRRASVFITVTKEVRPKQSIDMN